MNLNPKNILITGANSGIGAALAEAYASSGITLALGGRDRDRLEATAERCRAKGATVSIAALDVSDRAAMAEWVAAADAIAPLDLVIANAAVTGGLRPGGLPEGIERSQRLFSVNLFGALNTIDPAMEAMIARKSGQVVLVSSLAGYRGFPYSPSYSASKAALRVYGEALRGVLGRHGVTVSVVCPGFVDTPMNDRVHAPKPFMMTAAKAAALIKRKLRRGKRLIAFPLRLYLSTLLLAALPRGLTDFFLVRVAASVDQTDLGPDNAAATNASRSPSVDNRTGDRPAGPI